MYGLEVQYDNKSPTASYYVHNYVLYSRWGCIFLPHQHAYYPVGVMIPRMGKGVRSVINYLQS